MNDEEIMTCSFQLSTEMVPRVYLAAHQLRVETIFKGCSNYLAQQLHANNCLSKILFELDLFNPRNFLEVFD